jgi:hypothetical protein
MKDGDDIMHKLTRQEFLRTVAGAAAGMAVAAWPTAAAGRKCKIKLGVTLYSYTGDYGGTTRLEDCIADAAAMGAEGIELVGETHIPDYPNPPDRWIEQWHGWMHKYKTEPSCYDCRMDSRLWRTGRLSPEESLHRLLRDMELAKRLGFKVLRPAWKEATPEAGSGAATWRQMAQEALPYAEKYDVQLAPEVHSSNFKNSPIVEGYVDLVAKTRTRNLGVLLNGDRSGAPAAAEDSKPLLSILPYTLHVRTRFLGPYQFDSERQSWMMTEERQRYSAPFESLIPLLVQAGYAGYISSEYEGPCYAFLTSSHLGLQHARMKRLV